MSPHRPNSELIDRYLDGVATEAELVELARQLTNPGTVEEFVAASRMHHLLQELLREEAQVARATAPLQAIEGCPQPAKPSRRRPLRTPVCLGAAAAVLIVLGALLWGPFGGTLRHATFQEPTGYVRVTTPALVQPTGLGTPASGASAPQDDRTSTVTVIAIFGIVSVNAMK